MDDLIEKAHAYLDDKGCRSIGQKYTAFEIERMLADFAQQQLNLLNIPVVVGRSEQLPCFAAGEHTQCCNLGKNSDCIKCKHY